MADHKRTRKSGPRPDRNNEVRKKVRQKRIEKGLPVSDEESDVEPEEGVCSPVTFSLAKRPFGAYGIACRSYNPMARCWP
jgi:hypothetical protein